MIQTDSTPKVSVVVPIYQIERELPQCIESILQQTFSDFQLILVDDGSEDGCAKICDRYAQRDERVMCIHKKNGGLSSARNAGTVVARAEWITYVDGDDCIAPVYLEKMWEAVQRSGADVAVCMFSCTGNPSSREGDYAFTLNRVDAVKEMLYQKTMDVSACGKLYRTQVMRQNLFPVGFVFEDILPITKVICAAERVVVLPEQLYGYVQREGSIMHSRNHRFREDELIMTDKMFEYVQQNCPEAIRAARSKKYSNYCQAMIALSEQDENFKKKRRVIRRFLRANAFRVLFDCNVRMKNRGAAMIALVEPGLLKKLSRLC